MGPGSFGVLCFLFKRGVEPSAVEFVRALKLCLVRDKRHMVAWSLDVPARKVHKHRGFPLGLFPGHRVLEEALGAVA